MSDSRKVTRRYALIAGGYLYLTPNVSITEGKTLQTNSVVATDAITLEFDSRTDVLKQSISPRATFFRTAGYFIAGDGGGVLYIRAVAEPTHQFKVQSADGAWWEGVAENGAVDVMQFGAKLDGWTDDASAIQDAINYAEQIAVNFSTGLEVMLPAGEAVIGSSLLIDADGVTLVGRAPTATILRYTGSTGAAIEGNATLRTYVGMRNLTVRCDTVGGKGLDFTWFNYGEFCNLNFDLRESTQVGIYAKGNGLGTGPYYNNFHDISIAGQNDPAAHPYQIGVQLAPATTGALIADGPNGNNFANFKRVSGLDIGFDVESGNANLFTNIQVEAINSYSFAFNRRSADFSGNATGGTISTFTDSGASFSGLGGGAWRITAGTGAGESGTIRASTSTQIILQYYTRTGTVLDNTSTYEVYKSKAIRNRVTNLRLEGNSRAAQIARFYAGALGNVLSDVYSTSISSTKWTKDVAESSNAVMLNPLSQIVPLTFWIESPPAGTVTGSRPNPEAVLGTGLRMWSEGSTILGMSVACEDLSSIHGSGTISLFRGNVNFSAIDITLNADTRFGGFAALKTYDSATNAFMQPQHDLEVRITTDASWTGIDKVFTVIVWVQI